MHKESISFYFINEVITRKHFGKLELYEMLAPVPKWNNLKIIQTLIMKTKNIQGDEK